MHAKKQLLMHSATQRKTNYFRKYFSIVASILEEHLFVILALHFLNGHSIILSSTNLQVLIIFNK